MANKESFEQELELELEMELEREEILKKFSIDKEDEEEGDLTDDLSQNAVKSLVEDFDKDLLEVTETQVIIEPDFENVDEEFDDEFNEEDTVLLYNRNANVLELDDFDDMEELSDKTLVEEQESTPVKGSKIKRYYTVAALSVLVFITMVIILLVVIGNQGGSVATGDNLSTGAPKEPVYDADYVNKLINQNTELFKEVEDLRKDVARLSTTSSANVIEQVEEQTTNSGAESVVELPPIEPQEVVTEVAQPVVQVQTPPVEQVSKKPQKYSVQKGDTLYGISRKFYGSIHDYQKISSANNLKDDEIKFGDVLIIP